MKPSQHVVLSTGVSVAFWFWAKSVPATLVCFLSGILIDLDHQLEYWLITKKNPWNYKELVAYCSQEFIEKVYLVFHAFEWLIILWVCIFTFSLNTVWVGLAVGLTTHLIADTIYNPIKPYGYFISYRLSKGFCGRSILTEEYEKQHPTM